MKISLKAVTAGLSVTFFMSLAATASAAVTGTQAWTVQDVDGADPFIALDSAGNVIEGGLYGTTITKYNPAGQIVWSHSYAGSVTYQGASGALSGHGIVDSAGNVYFSTRIDFR